MAVIPCFTRIKINACVDRFSELNQVKLSTCDVPSGRKAMSELLPLKPSAVFTFNDHLALGAILAAQARGLSVPKDLSIAGFGNQGVMLNENNKRLTTVEFDLEEMGRLAAQMLFRRIDGFEGAPELSRAHAKLIVGDTTAKCSARRTRAN